MEGTTHRKVYGNIKKNTDVLQTELRSTEDVERFMSENVEEFRLLNVAEYLNQLLIDYNLEKCDIARRGGFTGNYPYQIFNGRKKASRDKLIQMALGFPLTVEETQDLLHLAGYAGLYVRNSRDAYLMFAIEKKFTFQKTNELLFRNKEKMLE